jgi:uracil-DNA glycosylase
MAPRVRPGEPSSFCRAPALGTPWVHARATGRPRSRGVTDLAGLRKTAATCTRCDLHRHATQTVFGVGDDDARMVLMGEQPGDREDVEGVPFVGPAGRLLDRALEAAEIDRREVYLTNAVKHFKWRPQGKVRLHQKPNAEEIRACAEWWQQELEAIRPAVVVLLGATAAGAALGSKVRVTRDRGVVVPAGEAFGHDALVTIHPSAVLRMKQPERDTQFEELVSDLQLAARHVAAG